LLVHESASGTNGRAGSHQKCPLLKVGRLCDLGAGWSRIDRSGSFPVEELYRAISGLQSRNGGFSNNVIVP
jgi:hypothetical protein